MADLDLSFGGLADPLGVNSRTIRRWADHPLSPDSRDVPPPVAGIIRLMVGGFITPRQMWQAVHGVKIDPPMTRSRKSSK